MRKRRQRRYRDSSCDNVHHYHHRLTRSPRSLDDHCYLEIDLRTKQPARSLATLPELHHGVFPTGDLLTWLASLGRPDYVQRPLPQPPN